MQAKSERTIGVTAHQNRRPPTIVSLLAMDLWLVTSPGGSSSDVSLISRPMVHRPLLCDDTAHTQQEPLSYRRLVNLAIAFLVDRQPHWFVSRDEPLVLVARPCAVPSERRFLQNCSAPDMQLSDDATIEAAMRTRQRHHHHHGPSAPSNELIDLVVVISGTWDAAQRRHAFGEALHRAKLASRREARKARVTAASKHSESGLNGTRGGGMTPSSLRPLFTTLSHAVAESSAGAAASASPSTPPRTLDTGPMRGWHQLRSCRHTQCAYRCHSSHAYANHLAHLPPLPTLDELLLPRHTHILLYGPSFLGQLADAIVCASVSEGPITTRAFEFPAAPPAPPPPPHPPPTSSRVLHGKYACCDGGVGEQPRGGTLVTHTFASRNASMTMVINYAPLQRSTDGALANLDAFARHGPATASARATAFTHLVFMQPHPECFFERQSGATRGKCVDLASTHLGAAAMEGPRPRLAAGVEAPIGSVTGSAHWRILSAHMPALYAFAWKAWRADMQRAWWNRTAPTPPERTITPEAMLGAPCMMGGCDARVPAGLGGHQCLPGSSTLVAREIVRALRRARRVSRDSPRKQSVE